MEGQSATNVVVPFVFAALQLPPSPLSEQLMIDRSLNLTYLRKKKTIIVEHN